MMSIKSTIYVGLHIIAVTFGGLGCRPTILGFGTLSYSNIAYAVLSSKLLKKVALAIRRRSA